MERLLLTSLKTNPNWDTGQQEFLKIGELQFKDLNRNGQLDVYEDWRLTHKERSQDLVSKMSLEQKAGFMLISSTKIGK